MELKELLNSNNKQHIQLAFLRADMWSAEEWIKIFNENVSILNRVNYVYFQYEPRNYEKPMKGLSLNTKERALYFNLKVQTKEAILLEKKGHWTREPYMYTKVKLCTVIGNKCKRSNNQKNKMINALKYIGNMMYDDAVDIL
jgi:hypothetical protein